MITKKTETTTKKMIEKTKENTITMNNFLKFVASNLRSGNFQKFSKNRLSYPKYTLNRKTPTHSLKIKKEWIVDE